MSVVDLASSQIAEILRHRYNVDTLEDDIKEIINSNITDIPCKLENSVKGYVSKTSVLSVLDILSDTNHCISGNGCVYENHDNDDEPRTKWLASKLKNRKIFKSKQFDSPQDSPEYLYYELLQKLEKLLANSEYGAVGSKFSSLYFQEGGSSTTLSGRIVVSTAACMFEQVLIPGNYQFDSFLDMIDFIRVCCKDEVKSIKCKSHSMDMLVKKFQSKCSFEFTPIHTEILERYLNSFPKHTQDRLYYKWNLYEFLEEDEMIRLMKSLISKTMNTTFTNPYDIPPNIADEVKLISTYIKDYVYQCGYSTHDRIVKFASMKRGVVIGADTDSNMIYTKATSNRIFELCDFVPSNNSYITFANLQAAILAPMIEDAFYSLSKSMNVPNRYLKQFAMKNEFLWTRIVLTLVKKRYVVKTIVQEGHLLDKPKIGITGHDFYKSNCPKLASDVFAKIIEECFLKNGEINLLEAIKRIENLSKNIRSSLLLGNIEYLHRVAIRPDNGLKYPWRHQGYRGLYYWNLLNPQYASTYVGKGALLYLTIYTLKDIPSEHPMYEIIKDNVFNNTVIPSSENNAKKLSSICIPDSYGKIPPWCIDFIDFDRIIDGITSTFSPALEPFGVVYKKNGTSKTKYTKSPTRLIQF